jgi:hypothetical protein
MNYHIRKIKTGSNNIAVQMIKYQNRKRVVVKHICSADNKEGITLLVNNASEWIAEQTKQILLFPEDESFISLGQCEYLGFQFTFLYEILHKLQAKLGYTCFGNKLLNDLVTIRIIEPASKLRSLEFLGTYFNIKHRRQTLYEILPAILKLKNKIEELTINFAVKEFDFDFAMACHHLYVKSTKSSLKY